jgi:hypothetical protein
MVFTAGGREYQCAGKTTRVREAELADRESVVSHMKTWAGLWWLSWPMKMT